MKARLSMGIYVAVLAVSGILAWLAFLPDGRKSAGSELVVDATSDQVDRLEYKTDKSMLQAVAFKDRSGFRLTIRQQLAKARANKPGTKDALEGKSTEENSPKEKVTRYRASKDFGDALKRVMPIESVRDLGRVQAEKLKEFGLEPPTAWLSLSINGQTVKFRVGKKTYGHSSFYLQQDPNGPVSLVSSALLSVVDFRPPRYKELRLLGLQPKKIIQMTMDCGSKGKRTFLHKDRLKPKAETWLVKGAEDSTDTLYRNWMKKLLHQSLVEYLEQAPKTVPGASCHFTFSMDGGAKTSAELAWISDPSGKQTYYGHSDFSDDWVRLEPSTASSVVADISSVLGVQGSDKETSSK